MLKKIFSKPIIVLACIAMGFFYLTSWLGAPPGAIWNSPDETANAFWIERVSGQEPLRVREFIVGIGAGVVHPRSFNVNGTALVPGSFPGLFLLYGGLSFFTGFPISAMTALLTLFAGLAFFALLRRLFDEKVAFWSSVFFFFHPAILYYTGRGLFHNMLFIDLLIFAVAFFILRPFSKKLGSVNWIDSVFAGILFGFAIITRASEAPWVLLSALAFLPFLGVGRWKRVGHVILGGLLPLFILLSFNASTYGSLLGSGYAIPSPVQEVTTGLVEGNALASEVQSVSASLLPFGFHPRLIVLHGMDYGLEIFWWFSLAGILGLTVFFMSWCTQDKKKRMYFYVTGAITIWLLVFYGSWFVRDHYDPTRVTIGTSYVRYFLPIYILTLPWVVQGLMWIGERITHTMALKKIQTGRVMVVFAILFALLSFRVAITEGDESLLAVRATLQSNLEKKNIILKAIDKKAVVMTERFDKLLFPEHMNIIPIMDETAFQTVPVILNYAPVYWYGVTPSEELLSRWQRMAREAGLRFEVRESPIEGESVFEFIKFEIHEEETQN